MKKILWVVALFALGVVCVWQYCAYQDRREDAIERAERRLKDCDFAVQRGYEGPLFNEWCK